MADNILVTRKLNKHFGGVKAADNVDLGIACGELHALIGPNGAGKTTLISLITGILKCDSGEIAFDGKRIDDVSAPSRSLMGLARSFQVTSILKDFTCQENVALAIQAHHGHSFRFWKPVSSEADIQDKAVEVLQSVGLRGHSDTIAGNLAYGEQRHLEIAIALATKPKLLVLDEPLAGMGRSDSATILEFLKSLKHKYTILLIEHDMDAVFALADRISVMVYGKLIKSDSPDNVRNDEFVRMAYLGHDD
ncbi:MAG: ABC transporter ATP-binding protein [Acidiferrobacterales bacterium]|nr:ABC transporter ATP-binding protein [Acidiferrobacterales bacterium]